MQIILSVVVVVLFVLGILFWIAGRKNLWLAAAVPSVFTGSYIVGGVLIFTLDLQLWLLIAVVCISVLSFIGMIVTFAKVWPRVEAYAPVIKERRIKSSKINNKNTNLINTPFAAAIIDRSKDLKVTLENNNGDKIDFERIDALYSGASGKEKLYAVLKMVGGSDDTVYIAEYVEGDDSLVTPAEVIATKVFDEWQGSLNRTGAIYGVQVYDVIVHKADWKQFRKRATQDELMALAIGSKLNLSGAMVFIKAAVSVVGTILSIVLGIALFDDFGMFSLIILVGGYLFFNLMASKLLGYLDTYNSCFSKLNSQNRDYIKSLFKEHVAVSILRMLVLWGLMLFTLPYKFLLMIIETLVPAARNWTIAHGGEAGAVITLPKGYDIGGLGALGQYYASFSFSDAWQQQMEEYEAARLAKYAEYTYQDKNGVTRTAYSNDGMHFYADKKYAFVEVGTSTDGGRTMERKGYYEQKDSRGNTTELKES